MELAVVIPSKNESDSIGYVVSRIDKGLISVGMAKRSIIINADNSPDSKTIETFSHTKTAAPKKVISTEGIGKGDNILAGMIAAQELGAEYVMTFDTDLKSFEPEWIQLFLDKLRTKTDLVIPMYARYWIEGGTTNHFCMPVIFGLTGRYIQQPIAGDFGLSTKLVDKISSEKFTQHQRRYGIDIFITGMALFEGMLINQVNLGRKIHKPSFPKTSNIFLDTASVLFNLIYKYSSFINVEHPDKILSLKLLDANPPTDLELVERARNARLLLHDLSDPTRAFQGSINEWIKILSEHLSTARHSSQSTQIAESLLPYFLLRTVNFLSGVKDADEASGIIVKQAMSLNEFLRSSKL